MLLSPYLPIPIIKKWFADIWTRAFEPARINFKTSEMKTIFRVQTISYCCRKLGFAFMCRRWRHSSTCWALCRKTVYTRRSGYYFGCPTISTVLWTAAFCGTCSKDGTWKASPYRFSKSKRKGLFGQSRELQKQWVETGNCHCYWHKVYATWFNCQRRISKIHIVRVVEYGS